MPRRSVGLTISAVAEAYRIHPQTLRLYEREGLLKPSRTQGNTRLYMEKDLQRLELILTLRRDLGVNLAGIDVILNMRETMERMRKEVQELIEYLHSQFDLDPRLFRERVKEALVGIPPAKLARIYWSEEGGITSQIEQKNKRAMER